MIYVYRDDLTRVEIDVGKVEHSPDSSEVEA